MKALMIENRKITLIDIDNSTPDDELHALQAVVGGYIETVTLAEDAVMIVDEEGLLKALNQNALASLVARQQIVGTGSHCGAGCQCGRRSSVLRLSGTVCHESACAGKMKMPHPIWTSDTARLKKISWKDFVLIIAHLRGFVNGK